MTGAPPTDCEQATKWLDEHFILSFRLDADPSLWPDIPNGNGNAPTQRGFFAITVLTLTYCNAMAGLMNGTSKAGTKEAIQFIESELGGSAGGDYVVLYRERAAFLYSIFRHRLVHRREPGNATINAHTIKWAIARSPQDEDWLHLRFRANAAGIFRFWVHADVLQRHALAAFESIRDRIQRGDAALARKILNGANEATAAQALVKNDKAVTSPADDVIGAYAYDAITNMLTKPDADPAILAKLDDIDAKMRW